MSRGKVDSNTPILAPLLAHTLTEQDWHDSCDVLVIGWGAAGACAALEAIADMPRRWREALAGDGELDLSGVRLLSDAHYLWSPGN